MRRTDTLFGQFSACLCFFSWIALASGLERAYAEAGSVDPTFTPATCNLTATVDRLVLDGDGHLFALGGFTYFNGAAVTNLVRLTPTGILDPSFSVGSGFVGQLLIIPGVFTNQSPPSLLALAAQGDGKVVVGGDFTSVHGTARKNLVRLTLGGAVDAGFDPQPDAQVLTILPLSDGKLLVGGAFKKINGVARDGIALLKTDGSLDPGFVPSWGGLIGGGVQGIAIQPDGKLVVVGGIRKLVGFTPTMIGVARLNADGSLDTTFNAPSLPLPNNVMVAVAIQKDGKILVGGGFPSIGGVARAGIARLNADGSLDASWTAPGTSGIVKTIRLQPDGKAILGGTFTSFNGVSRAGMVRLNQDGEIDTTFANPPVTALLGLSGAELQPDGNVLIYGGFSQGSQPMNILRLKGDSSSLPGIPVITGQPESQAVNAGAAVSFTVTAQSASLLSYQWRHNGKDIEGATGPVLSISQVQQLDGGIYTVVVSNASGSVTSQDALLNPVAPGWPDFTFDNSGTDPLQVNALYRQGDGRILVAGYFTKVDGFARNLVARLNADGTVDPGFVPSTSAAVQIFAVAAQSDGRAIVGGNLGWPNDGVAYRNVGRLQVDGSLDKAFNLGTGPNDQVFAVAVQADDKVLIGGFFNQVNGVARRGVARLNPEGDLDLTFVPDITWVSAISAIAIQPGDGKILVAGKAGLSQTTPGPHVIRLLANGQVDSSFSPGLGANEHVRCVAVQPDGRILIGGDFGEVNRVSRNGLARLNSDGSLDASFDPGNSGPIPATVLSIAVQPDGKIVVAGAFETYRGLPRRKIVRLLPNGSVDPSFQPETGANNSSINALLLLPDGNLLAGGDFTEYDGLPFQRLLRLHGGGPPGGAPLQVGISGTDLVLTWTDPAYTLQSAEDLLKPQWNPVTGASPQRVRMGARQGFYRLVKP